MSCGVPFKLLGGEGEDRFKGGTTYGENLIGGITGNKGRVNPVGGLLGEETGEVLSNCKAA